MGRVAMVAAVVAFLAGVSYIYDRIGNTGDRIDATGMFSIFQEFPLK